MDPSNCVDDIFNKVFYEKYYVTAQLAKMELHIRSSIITFKMGLFLSCPLVCSQ